MAMVSTTRPTAQPALGGLLGALLLLGGCSKPPPAGGPLSLVTSFGEVGDSPGQFSYPRCMDTDGSQLWVIDKQAWVQRVDAKTGECTLGWRMPEYENGRPCGMSVFTPPGGATRVYVADTHYHRVMIYEPVAGPAGSDVRRSSGKLVAQFGSYGEGDGQFIFPTDVGILPTPDGTGVARLYVSEYGGHDRVSVYEPSPGSTHGGETEFVFRFAFGRYGSGSGEPVEFSRPQSVEIDRAAHEVVITDACNHRIGRFTYEGKLVRWIGGPEQVGDGIGQMKYPYGLVLLGDGTAMVSEFGGNRVQRFELATGTSLGIYGETGRRAGDLATPWAIAAMHGRVYILDSGNNRVQVIDQPTGRHPLKQTTEQANDGNRASPAVGADDAKRGGRG